MEPIFTVDQIKTAHSKVKSGADFPACIQEIKQMGVQAFETFLVDSHTIYSGPDGYQTASSPMYASMAIANETEKEKFLQYLKIHQQGETDYLTFCRHCAETGVEKWAVSLTAMNRTYYDRKGVQVTVEKIPG